jgi:Na+/proline symporter
MGFLGIPELIMLAALSGVLAAIGVSVWFVVRLLRSQRRQAREAGFQSLSEYLQAAPQTDREKQAAVDLALKGVVICLLGLIVPPLLLIGLFPLFYGVRKIIYASMGLGLLDDARR